MNYPECVPSSSESLEVTPIPPFLPCTITTASITGIGMTSHLFSNAQNTTINGGVHVLAVKPSSTNPLDKLEKYIAPQAMHDSSARSDAPKCHPDTRVAVQDEIYSWVVHGDSDPEPKKIKWITGPAGTGKTAIAGSLAEQFDKEGVLAATFFFSSSSPYPGQRTKGAWIPTIAHQLAQRHGAFKDGLARAIEQNPLVFDKNLEVKMEKLILQPLRQCVGQSNVASSWRGVIIVDGLDECGVELDPELQAPVMEKHTHKRKKEADQLEILQVLLRASSDPDFPFHIIIVSRPERVFRAFFKPDDIPVHFATILTLDEKYNPDADITLFLKAKFKQIQREYNLPASWLPRDAIRTLVENASGQFIYVATAIGFMMAPSEKSPPDLLNVILEIRPTPWEDSGNPFAHLDALYARILQSSPNPILAAKWIWVIGGYRNSSNIPPAYVLNELLQENVGEATHLLGPLHSLIKVPSPNDDETPYSFYHKSLFDFLGDSQRAGAIGDGLHDWVGFYSSKYWEMLLRIDSYPDSFRPHFLNLKTPRASVQHRPLINKWVKLCISMRALDPISDTFHRVHMYCHRWLPCALNCFLWRRPILRLCKKANWTVFQDSGYLQLPPLPSDFSTPSGAEA